MAVTFNAEQINKNIKITCTEGVSWSCRVDGNFGISTYEGVGATTLTITYFDDEDKNAYGNIIFSYHDGNCLKHLELPVYYTEQKAWLSVFPTTDEYSRSLANEYKIFTLKTNLPKSSIDISAPDINNYEYFITDNFKLYLIKKDAINTKIILQPSIYNTNKGKITITEIN